MLGKVRLVETNPECFPLSENELSLSSNVSLSLEIVLPGFDFRDGSGAAYMEKTGVVRMRTTQRFAMTLFKSLFLKAVS